MCRELFVYSIRTGQLTSFWPVLINGNEEILTNFYFTNKIFSFSELSNNGFDSNKGQILLNLIIFSLEKNETFDVFQLVCRIFQSFSLTFCRFFVQIETIVEQSEKLFAEIFDFLSSTGRKSHQQTSIDLIKKMVRRKKNEKKKERSLKIFCLDRKTWRSFGKKIVGISIENLRKTFKIVR